MRRARGARRRPHDGDGARLHKDLPKGIGREGGWAHVHSANRATWRGFMGHIPGISRQVARFPIGGGAGAERSFCRWGDDNLAPAVFACPDARGPVSAGGRAGPACGYGSRATLSCQVRADVRSPACARVAWCWRRGSSKGPIARRLGIFGPRIARFRADLAL